MPQQYVKRVTLFKVPKAEDIDEASDIIEDSWTLHKQLTTWTGASSLRSLEERCKAGMMIAFRLIFTGSP